MVEDFAWWSGLSIAEARRGLGPVRSRLDRLDVEGRTYWLADYKMPDDCACPDFGFYQATMSTRWVIGTGAQYLIRI